MKKQPSRLLKDDSGHYYLIPDGQQGNFYQWVEDQENGFKSVFDFSKYSLGGGPQGLLILDWEE